VLSSVSQICSGASAAVTAAFTAAVTSIPGEEDPKAASRIELMSMPDDPDADDKSELSEDAEVLIANAFSLT
jgi:hypothetical protein